MADIVSGEIDVAAHRCPTCGQPRTNGHTFAGTEPALKRFDRVEVSSREPVIAGTRLGRFIAELPDGRYEVALDGGDVLALSRDVVHRLGVEAP
jgi:hypothetical protein